ncbi:unnamed protein product, partial [Rotaria sp. Silwood2]
MYFNLASSSTCDMCVHVCVNE